MDPYCDTDTDVDIITEVPGWTELCFFFLSSPRPFTKFFT